MPPDLTGYYRFVSQKNLEDYLQALSNGLAPLNPFTPLLSSPFLPLTPLRSGGMLGPGHDGQAGGRGCWPLTWALFLARGITRRK